MKIGHFGGIKPGDILPVADIYESNCGETPASNVYSVSMEPKRESSESVRHAETVNALTAEITRLKARIRALEPEQPQPRPLYRWGRPV